MSTVLADVVTGRHDLILRVLEVITTERKLDLDGASVAALLQAEVAADAAARAYAGAVDALPPAGMHAKPAGWGQPPVLSGVPGARRRLTRAVLRCLLADCADESAGAGYADEQLAHAARNLAADLDAEAAAETGQTP